MKLFASILTLIASIIVVCLGYKVMSVVLIALSSILYAAYYSNSQH